MAFHVPGRSLKHKGYPRCCMSCCHLLALRRERPIGRPLGQICFAPIGYRLSMQRPLAALPEMFGWDPPAGEWTAQLQSNIQDTEDLDAGVAEPSAVSGAAADQLDGGFEIGLNNNFGQDIVTEMPWGNSAYYSPGFLESPVMYDGSAFNMRLDYDQGGVSQDLPHDLTTAGTLQEALVPANEVAVAMADGTHQAGQDTMAGPLIPRPTPLARWGNASPSGGASGSSSTNVGDFFMVNNTRSTNAHPRPSQHTARTRRWAPYELRRESTSSLTRRQRELEEERDLVRDELLRRSEQLALTATETTDAHDNAGVIVSPRSTGHVCPFDAACNVPVEDFKRHYRELHSNIEVSICQWRFSPTSPRCRTVLKSFGSLLKHLKQVHLKDMACKCSRCGRQLSRSDALTRHMRKCLRFEEAEASGDGSTVLYQLSVIFSAVETYNTMFQVT
ncbi:uncharacterized protein B0H18DRAFT_1009075 [Fomitopsis serialis]|uniref:uncharacterized protein n=1 Tax=Fomitopsis serialis TaxID=139415 RepID=UPI0020088C4B|nr:uncharacterized protein B0H18DRAFT_1009075 [Neoantrodia serialis]KAH9925574.1 hypothetical protein B0H18DRAFT_1009075 [Neoantrodia serialis]